MQREGSKFHSFKHNSPQTIEMPMNPLTCSLQLLIYLRHGGWLYRIASLLFFPLLVGGRCRVVCLVFESVDLNPKIIIPLLIEFVNGDSGEPCA